VKLARCPVCHAHIHLDALIQDEAGRALMGVLAQHHTLYRPLVAYLTLFRPEKRDLANDRALTLVEEALALEKKQDVLKAALIEAVEAAREKSAQGLWKPPKDHGWLKAFLKNARVAQGMPAKPPRQRPEPVTEDVPPEQVRARREAEPGMPANIKAAFTRILRGQPADETDEQREARLERSRAVADEALMRADALKK